MLTGTKTAAALGLFDGVHLGHRRVLKKAVEFEKNALLPVCFTFNNQSLQNKQERKIQYIYSHEQKCRYILQSGIKKIFSFDFEDIRKLSPEEFVSKILCEEMNCAAVVCGEDFRFGFNACADAFQLEKICARHGIECHIVSQVLINGLKVSSADIRNALSDGDISTAQDLLGRNFSIYGKVFCDKRRGTEMGIPTINLKCSAPLRSGVYASRTLIDGDAYNSISNVGVRPTFYDDSDFVAETHILDFNRNLYDKEVEVVFKGFIRDEKRFESAQELIAQIERDIETLRLF